MLLFALLTSLASANLRALIMRGFATEADVLSALEAGHMNSRQAQSELHQIQRCPNGFLQNSIPRWLTPMPEGGTIGYGSRNHGVDEFPEPWLGCCTEPIADGIPDMTGMYAIDSPVGRVFARIEQCGTRYLVGGNGVIHDWPAINDDATVLTDVSSLCVGMPSSFADNPVEKAAEMGVHSSVTCEQMVSAGGQGCSCHLREVKAYSHGQCVSLYEHPGQDEVTWCKQENGDIIRTMQNWVNGKAVPYSQYTFHKYVPGAVEPAAGGCPDEVQKMINSGKPLSEIKAMIVEVGGDVSMVAGCADRRKM